MGRKDKYETHVKPRLNEIAEWYGTMTEREIAKNLGISTASFENYKIRHPELKSYLQKGKEILIGELKTSLKKKAKGFYFKETKRTYIEVNGEITSEIKVEETEKYAAPDTGAIHLLLKNLDPEWRNDDQITIDMKREKMELEKEKAENIEW